MEQPSLFVWFGFIGSRMASHQLAHVSPSDWEDWWEQAQSENRNKQQILMHQQQDNFTEMSSSQSTRHCVCVRVGGGGGHCFVYRDNTTSSYCWSYRPDPSETVNRALSRCHPIVPDLLPLLSIRDKPGITELVDFITKPQSLFCQLQQNHSY